MKTDLQKVRDTGSHNKVTRKTVFRITISNVPAVQAKSLKDEGNAFFKEKNYDKSILAYTAALKKKCDDDDLNTVLFTNRAAAHFHLGSF